jgi:hypothetical protein
MVGLESGTQRPEVRCGTGENYTFACQLNQFALHSPHMAHSLANASPLIF